MKRNVAMKRHPASRCKSVASHPLALPSNPVATIDVSWPPSRLLTATHFVVAQTVSGSELSPGDRNTDDKNSPGRGGRPPCRYVTIPPKHVSRCDQGDVADDDGVSDS